MAAPAAGAPPAARTPAVSAFALDVLWAEFVAGQLRNHGDGRVSQEALYGSLEGAGYAVGRRWVERATRERERFGDTLDAVKFLCREFWADAFRKAVDKLQTNNRGVFVLQDFNFRPTRHVSAPVGADTPAAALPHVLGPCGMIRGALAGLGYEASVNADVSALPRVVFQVRIMMKEQAAAQAAQAAAGTGAAPSG
jgi:hypothetical protein